MSKNAVVRLTGLLLASLSLAACSSGLEAPLPTLNTQATSTTLTIPLVSATDDAEEKLGGGMELTGGLLDFRAKDGVLQTVGVRFQNVAIPQGAKIASAYFTVKGGVADTGSVTLKVSGEATDNALTFTSSKNNISSRAKTTASVLWPPNSWVAGGSYKSGNIAAVVQEVVSRSGWQSGNALSLVIEGVSGTAERSAIAFGGAASNVPALVVTFSGDTTPTTPTPTEPTPTPTEPVPTPPAGSTSVSAKLAATTDDIEELSSGTISVGKALDFALSGQKVGLRFSGLTIPQGATITSASIALTALVADSGSVNLTFKAQAADSAPTFTTTAKNVSSRLLTTASAVWQPSAWSVGQVYYTGDLSKVVQEVVSRSGWQSGSAIAFVVTGDTTNKRSASARDKDAVSMPILNVSYTLPVTPAPEPEPETPTPEPEPEPQPETPTPEPEPEPETPSTPSAEQTLWLSRLRSSIDSGRYAQVPSKNELEPLHIARMGNSYYIGRFGNMLETAYVLAYRETGDRKLMDFVNEFMLLAQTGVADHNGDGYRDILFKQAGEYYNKDTAHMDEMLTHGTLASLTLALRDAGYSSTASWWTDYLKNDYAPKWQARGGIKHLLTHPRANYIRYYYAMYKLTGDSSYMSKAESEAALLKKTIRSDGWAHWFGQSSGCAPMVYVPLTVIALADLATNGSSLIDTATMQRAANVVATKAMTDDNGTFLAGDTCGSGAYGSSSSIATFSFTPIAAWDSSGRITAISERVYNATERYNLSTPLRTPLPAALTFVKGH